MSVKLHPSTTACSNGNKNCIVCFFWYQVGCQFAQVGCYVAFWVGRKYQKWQRWCTLTITIDSNSKFLLELDGAIEDSLKIFEIGRWVWTEIWVGIIFQRDQLGV